MSKKPFIRLIATTLAISIIVLFSSVITPQPAYADDVLPSNTAILGNIKLFAFQFEPEGWCRCDGREFRVYCYPNLFSIINTRFGGDGITTFRLPDLRQYEPQPAGTSSPQVHYYMCVDGMPGYYGDELLGTILILPYLTAPQGLVRCNGQLLTVSTNQALFSIIGTKFTRPTDNPAKFRVPDLRGAEFPGGIRFYMVNYGMYPTRG